MVILMPYVKVVIYEYVIFNFSSVYFHLFLAEMGFHRQTHEHCNKLPFKHVIWQDMRI